MTHVDISFEAGQTRYPKTASVKLMVGPERASFLSAINQDDRLTCWFLRARIITMGNTSLYLTLYKPLMLSSPKTLLRVW